MYPEPYPRSQSLWLHTNLDPKNSLCGLKKKMLKKITQDLDEYTLENYGWNPKMEVSKMIFLFNCVIFRFHVNFQGCNLFACSRFTHSWCFPFRVVALEQSAISRQNSHHCLALLEHLQTNGRKPMVFWCILRQSNIAHVI